MMARMAEAWRVMEKRVQDKSEDCEGARPRRVFHIRVTDLDFISSIIKHHWVILSFMKSAYHLSHKNLFNKDIPQILEWVKDLDKT